ncbi:MAG: hypothetical protein WA323_04945 [Candidatus Nitrosopolaris sp.]
MNIFRNMLGLSEAKWDQKEEEEQKRQQEYPTRDQVDHLSEQ